MRFSIAPLLLAGAACAIPTSSSTDLHSLVRRDGSGSVTGYGVIWYDSNTTHGTTGRSNPSSYSCYSGPFQNFPAINTWMSFDNMWALQKRVNIGPIGNNATEVQWIYNAILLLSAIAKVDARVILAVTVLESTGNLRVACTTSYGGVQNCGIMQSYNPTDTSYNGTQASVTQMVIDGTQGTAAGPGLVQWFNHAPDVSFDTQGNLYKVLRGYNSGAINETDLSDGEGANPYYVSHVANYLQGWDGSGGFSSCSFSSSTPTPTANPAATCSSAKYTPAPTQTVSGTTKNCCTWYTVQSGDTCDKIDKQFGITLTQFRQWNTYINDQCTNLFANYAYCVSSNDGLPGSSSSVSATPTPSSTSSSTTRSTTTPTSTSTSTSTRPTTSSTITSTTQRPTTTTTTPPTSSTNAFGTCPSGVGARYTASNRKIFTQASCGTDYGGGDTGSTKVVTNLAGCAEHCATVSNCVRGVLRTASSKTVCWPKATAKASGNAVADATAVDLVATASASARS